MADRRLVKGATIAVCTTVVVAAGLWQAASAQELAGPSAAAADATWTGTWAASPQNSGASFGQQTLRQIVHTSISGTAARVQLSNAFGSAPVTVADIHLARRTSGSSVDTGTDRPVTFGGSTSVTIPAGAKAVSDSVAFAVAALSDVAVSFYLPQQVTNATQHQLAEQTNYVAGGDVAGNATLPGAQTNGSYTFLADLDVQNSAAEGAVATLGASITDGVASAGNANRRWPNDLAVRLNQAGRTIGVLNQGISGNALLHDGAGQSAVNRFNRDVIQQPNVKWVIFADDPINDINNANPPSAGQLTAALTQIINAAHQAGIKFLCATLTPFKPDSGWTQAGENSRAGYDAFVRGANSGCDGVVDIDTATHDPANPQQYLPAYDSGDHLHPNTDGLQAMANAVNLNLFTSTGTPTTPPPGNPPVVSLRAHANGRLVTAEAAGAQPLIANRDAVGAWEQFDRIDTGNNTIALRAHANNRYVTAPSGGASSLIATSTTIGTAETFRLVSDPDGGVSLVAVVNGQYVTAEAAGAQPLIANRQAVGLWEEFDLIGG
jgi:lysophospholipase L1-like esterase